MPSPQPKPSPSKHRARKWAWCLAVEVPKARLSRSCETQGGSSANQAPFGNRQRRAVAKTTPRHQGTQLGRPACLHQRHPLQPMRQQGANPMAVSERQVRCEQIHTRSDSQQKIPTTFVIGIAFRDVMVYGVRKPISCCSPTGFPIGPTLSCPT